MTAVNNSTSAYHWFIELNWVQKLLFFVIILLASAFIFRVLTPSQANVQTAILSNTLSRETNLQNIDFQGTYPRIPAQLPTASIEYQEISDPLTQKLFSAFSIASQPATEGVWRGDEYEVVKTDDPLFYHVSRLSDPVKSAANSEGFNQQMAIAEATKIIDGIYGTEAKPTVITSDIQTMGGDEGIPLDGEPSPQTYILIPFAYTLQDTPIYVNRDTTYAASIMLDSSYALQKASFRPYTLTTSNIKNYSTVDPEEALGQVNQNNASVVFYQYRGPNAADFSSIDSGTMTLVTLEYRADTTTKTVVPYYKFTGPLKNSAGYEITTDIITPAIKTNFDKPESE